MFFIGRLFQNTMVDGQKKDLSEFFSREGDRDILRNANYEINPTVWGRIL